MRKYKSCTHNDAKKNWKVKQYFKPPEGSQSVCFAFEIRALI